VVAVKPAATEPERATERDSVKRIWLIAAACIAGSSLAACGAQPTRTVETPSVAQSAPAVSSAPTASAVPAEPADPAVAAQPVKKVPGGYRLVKRNGKELYCRSVTMIGTRFAEQMCFTREQIAEIEERTDHAMDDFEQARKTCTGGPYCTEL
jgi:hypothetical protein